MYIKRYVKSVIRFRYFSFIRKRKMEREKIMGSWKLAQRNIDLFEFGYKRGFEDGLYSK